MSSCSQDESFGDISNEDIKHLVFRTEPEEVNFTMYRSKFKDLARQQLKSGRDCHRTMGFANGFYAPSPEQFLKKRSRKLYVAQVEKPEKKPGKEQPPVPRKDDWNNAPARVEQNFLINNIRKAVRSVPPTGPSRAFDTALGRRVHNCNLLIPTFAWSENFAKVPEYIRKMKEKQMKREMKQKENVEAPQEETRIHVISEADRQEMLKNLKNVWAELQREFQVLPVLNDTLPKIKRKEALEAKLIEVEKDIKLIEDNLRIYIIQDPKDTRCAKPHDPDPCYQHLNSMRRKTML
ncbi:enkurin, TRPC channel interacting protein [Nesidiocoris tenuis]|uniref:Enkurin, TRPC channel interacting protein n=1 Tax=Nesidiocoris tenuis TaxID=355587 RepID=A0ABN7AXV4_9HEMI|nr:enkurin, TRPC channel interacting protein [Nesidiocoris tenuis]